MRGARVADAPLEPPRSAPRRLALAAVLVAGLALTHYLVTVFLALFALAWLASGPAAAAVPRLRVAAAAVARLAVAAAAAVGLVTPWVLRLRGSIVVQAATDLATRRLADADVYGVVAPAFTWGQLGLHVGWALTVAALAAAVWGLAVRDRTVRLGLLWAVAMVVASYPAAIGLPVTGVLKDFTVAIALYVPAALVIGAATGAVAARAARRGGRAMAVLGAAALGVVLVLAWRDRAPLVPANVLLAPEDGRAMDWIDRNTPPEAVFLVSCGPAFGGTVCAGEDAGWWLTLLTGRRSTVPPLNYALERPLEPGYRARVNDLAALWRADLDAADTRAAFDAAGVTHAYAGTRPGTLDRARLAASPFWSLVYDEGGAQVFARRPG